MSPKLGGRFEGVLTFVELGALVVGWCSLLGFWKPGLLGASVTWASWRLIWAYLLEQHFRVGSESGVARRRLASTIWFGRVELGVLVVGALVLSSYGRGSYEALTAALGWFVAHVFWREELKLWQRVRLR